MNKEKCDELITNRMMWNNEYCFGEDPMVEEHFWIPLQMNSQKMLMKQLIFGEHLQQKNLNILLNALTK